MSVLKLKLTTGTAVNQLVRSFETPGGNHSIAQRIENFISSLQTGTKGAAGVGLPPSINIDIQDNEVQASGGLTFISVVATNTFSINGVTFTAVASAPTNNQFVVGGTDIITAANAAAAINASTSALIAGYVTATSSTDVVEIFSVFYGLSGNTMTTVGSTNITAAQARLTGGAVDPTAMTLSF